MFGSARSQLLFNSLIVSLATVLAIGVVATLLVDRTFSRLEERYLQQQATHFAPPLEEILGQEVLTRQERDLRLLVAAARLATQARVQVTDAQGRLLADSGGRVVAGAFRPGEAVITEAPIHFYVDERGRIWGVRPGAAAERPFAPIPENELFALPAGWLPGSMEPATMERQQAPLAITVVSDAHIRRPLEVNGRVVGYLEISEGPALRQWVVTGTRRALLGGAGVALLVAAVVGLISAHQVTNPLAKLGTAAEAMAAGNLAARAPHSRLREFDRLAQQFNAMADRLTQTISALEADRTALRRLIADVSHEIRTPLAALKTFNELAAGEQTVAAEPLATFVRESQKQITQLDRLTTGLLDLSRMEAGLNSTTLISGDIRPVVEAAVSGLRPLAEGKRQLLTLEVPDAPVLARHDAATLQQAVGNLVHNAIKYAPQGGHIHARLAAGAAGAEIEVQDDGPGIAAADRPFIFERFYRGRNQGNGGTGLGLAICKEIVKAHQGTITFENQEGQGSVFRIRLPAVQSK